MQVLLRLEGTFLLREVCQFVSELFYYIVSRVLVSAVRDYCLRTIFILVVLMVLMLPNINSAQVLSVASIAKADTTVELTEAGLFKAGSGVCLYRFYKGYLYVLVYREARNKQLYLHIYDVTTMAYVNGYLIEHAFAGDAPLDFDVNDRFLAVVGYTSRLVYEKNSLGFSLLHKEVADYRDVRTFYQHVGLVCDTLVAFVRDYPCLHLTADEALEVVVYHAGNGKLISRVYLPADVPELGLVKPNHRVTFGKDKIVVGNYNQVELFLLQPPFQHYTNLKQLAIAVSPPSAKQISQAKSAALKKRSLEPLEQLLTTDLVKSTTVLCDVHLYWDSLLITRSINPRKGGVLNNRLDIWRINGTLMENMGSYADWENDRDIQATHKWEESGYTTANSQYLIYKNKVFFFKRKVIEEARAPREALTVDVFSLDIDR